jgi:hypothetical protein
MSRNPRSKTTERIPPEVFGHPLMRVDLVENVVTAADGRVWTDCVIGPPEVIEQIKNCEPHAPLEAWGVRVQN